MCLFTVALVNSHTTAINSNRIRLYEGFLKFMPHGDTFKYAAKVEKFTERFILNTCAAMVFADSP